MDNPFSWDYLTTVPGPDEVWGPFSIAYVVIFVAGFILTLGTYTGWFRGMYKNPVLYQMARRWSGWGLALFSAGLFFFLIRWLQINPFTFGMRIWLWICLGLLLVWIGWMIYDYQKHYADLKAAWDEKQLKERYLKQVSGRLQGRAAKSVPQAPPGRPKRRKR